MKYFVVYGYESPDCCTSSGGQPVLQVAEFDTPEQVTAFYAEFREGTEGNREVSHVTFRVFHGTELKLQPKAVTTTWELK